jgi:transcriptional regulator with XRE-family HTH domain
MVTARKTALRSAFGRVVRELRIRSGLTQEQLSFKAKLHRTYIGDLERGLKSPTLDVIDAIAVALGVEAHVLVEATVRTRGRSSRKESHSGMPRQRVRNRPAN